jgi:hypothetical protein
MISQAILMGLIVFSNLMIQLIVEFIEKQNVSLTTFDSELRSMKVNFVLQFKISAVVMQVISFFGLLEKSEGLDSTWYE